jgi:hypothetical protein
MKRAVAEAAKAEGTDVMVRCFGPGNVFKAGKIVDVVKRLKGGCVMNYAKIRWAIPVEDKEFGLVALSRVLSGEQLIGRSL